MSVAYLDPSVPLKRAARDELQRIDGSIARIDSRLTALNDERAKLGNERTYLLDRRQLIERILNPSPADGSAAVRGIALRGSALRVEAGRLLMETVGPHRTTHYRQWFEMVAEAGFVVLGKRPQATFLTGVGRSPVVRRGDEPGTYYIDPSLATALTRELDEVRAELEDLESVLAHEPGPSLALRQHRVKLLARRRHLEARCAEAAAVVGNGDAPSVLPRARIAS
jgi:hypothetical protein